MVLGVLIAAVATVIVISSISLTIMWQPSDNITVVKGRIAVVAVVVVVVLVVAAAAVVVEP